MKIHGKIDTPQSTNKGGLSALGAVVVTAVVTSSANAALVAPTFAIDDVTTVAGALLVGLAAFWAIRKALSVAR